MIDRTAIAIIVLLSYASLANSQELDRHRLSLEASMVSGDQEKDDATALVDEQQQIIGRPVGKPKTNWTFPNSQPNVFPQHASIDLKSKRKLASLWIFDTNGTGELQISIGSPEEWTVLTTHRCGKYQEWVEIPLDCESQFLRLTRLDGAANFSEIALYQYTDEAFAALQERKAAEAKALAEKMAALEKAREEMRKRPLVEVGEPFGKLYLIDEIDTSKVEPLEQYPADISKIETILGKPCRVLPKTSKHSTYMTYRIGKLKLLEPGMTYLLEIEYPEDAPRSWIVMNAGNESSLGFHTGSTFGDALHPKYVNNLNESIHLPLSGRYETWTSLFQLHDRTPEIKFIRGDNEPRTQLPEDGFTVTIAQFSDENVPLSHGAAVSRIRLLAIPNPDELDLSYRLPADLPHRHLFWREEMSDGVLAGDESRRGVTNMIDWWKFKRNRMTFLGFNTFCKDLLEFGSVQHWDTTPHGGNDWAYFSYQHKDLWPQIVSLMGEAGFNILPYYEYSGSKGANGLGNERLAKPLTRDDAYSHTSWIESSNADLTDPRTYDDFRKMLDITIVRQQDKANFVGAWLRSRGSIPMSFADTTLERFVQETNRSQSITRQDLIDDEQLLAQYKAWWNGKRHEFLTAMAQYLREQGIEDAAMLFTAEPAETGTSFPTWDRIVVADDPKRLDEFKDAIADKQLAPTSLESVVASHRYQDALKAEALNWGGWELNHRDPPSDPATYRDSDSVMLTHPFNRLYSVSDPASFDDFRNDAGLAMIRHFALNEDMIYDEADKPLLGYFVVDMERAGPYCMMSEAVAMAKGDPTSIGYLPGNNFNRGFPKYVRRFNAAFLSLPALPSEIVPNAASDESVVVREIKTDGEGTYLAVVCLASNGVENVTIQLPSNGQLTNAPTGEKLDVQEGAINISMYPFEMRAFHIGE